MNSEQKQPSFVPGLILAEGFFHEEVEPILRSHYPDLRYSAALIGIGSEVLEFDTEMSTDHHWGPRVMLFLSPDDFKYKRDGIRCRITTRLSDETNSKWATYIVDKKEIATRILEKIEELDRILK